MEMTLFQAIGIFVTVIILIVPTYWRYYKATRGGKDLECRKRNYKSTKDGDKSVK